MTTVIPAPRVLVVCTGNLCRSPLAAAMLTRDLVNAGQRARVRSAGTAAPECQAPDRKLLRVAEEHGLDLSDHRSVQLTRGHLTEADLILTMTAQHAQQVSDLVPHAAARTIPLRAASWRAQVMRGGGSAFPVWVSRLAAAVPEAERPRRDTSNDIVDPIGGPLRGYRHMAGDVAGLVAGLVAGWAGR